LEPGTTQAVHESSAATDPNRAQLIADAERIARSFIEDSWKASTLVEIAGALAATDPDR